MFESERVSVPKEIIGSKLIELAQENEKIVVLSSDVSVSCNVDGFKEEYAERFFEMGIAEQSTMSVAGGLATEGFIPVYVALAIFSNGMTWAQTRQLCNANLNVKIIGTHPGVDDGQDGSGHHATEDIAISRVIPRMTVLTPSDEIEVAAAIKAMVNYDGPVYMRVARDNQPIIHEDNYEFKIGKVEVLQDKGEEFALLFEGSALKQALDGWKALCEAGRKGKLVSVCSIKPLDEQYIKKVANEVDTIVTIENHSILGGLYGAVSECLGSVPHKARIVPVGFADEFMESGSSTDIKEKYGLSGKKIVEAVLKNTSK